MSYSKFLQGFLLGFAVFSVFWDYLLSNKTAEVRGTIPEAWDNVGKSISKAIKDYESTTCSRKDA